MSTANTATPFPPTLFPSCCPAPRPVRELSAAPCTATPPARELAFLEHWLASCRALQLPLHQIEAQQQTKGREVQRLLLQGWVKAQWKKTETNRRARYYTLTPAGRKQLGVELSQFEQMITAIGRVLQDA